MNEWQQLLADALISTGNVECSAILKKEDCSIKASSLGYHPTSDQVKSLVQAFENRNYNADQSINFNGATYRCIKADSYSIYATKEDSGFICVKTKSLLIFGSYSSHMNPSVCAEAVEKLGQYLSEKGE